MNRHLVPPSSPDRWSLIGRFALAAAFVFVAVGIATHVLLGRIVTQQYRDFADFHAEFVVRTVIEDHLEAGDVRNPVRGARYDELVALTEEFVLLEDVFRVKLWRPDGTIVFSDEPVWSENASTRNGSSSVR